MTKIETRRVKVNFLPSCVRDDPDAPDLDALGLTEHAVVEVEAPWFCCVPDCHKPYDEPFNLEDGPSVWTTNCSHSTTYSQTWVRAWHLKNAATPKEEPSGQLVFNWR